MSIIYTTGGYSEVFSSNPKRFFTGTVHYDTISQRDYYRRQTINWIITGLLIRDRINLDVSRLVRRITCILACKTVLQRDNL